MAEKINVGYSVKVETKIMIDELARLTHRTPGHVLDWVIEEAWEQFEKKIQPTSIVDEALAEKE